MPPSSGISVRNERVGAVDWSDQGYTDEALGQRIDESLPKLFERLRVDDGNAECSVNLSGNRLRGQAPIASLLRRLREAQVQVTTIRLHKNQLTDEAMQALVEHIERAATDSRPLMELHLSDNRLTEAGIRNLVKAAHRCKAYSRSDATSPPRNGGRIRALWLRTENQRPVITDPHGILERLGADGFSVCLLPSKEYVPPSGKGKSGWASLEAPVHMHQAFAPRSDRVVSADPTWSGKGDAGWSKGEAGGSREWWSEGSKGKENGYGGKGKSFGKGESYRDEKGASYREERGAKGKGKGDWDAGASKADGWDGTSGYRGSWRLGGRGEDGSEWRDWGHDEDRDDEDYDRDYDRGYADTFDRRSGKRNVRDPAGRKDRSQSPAERAWGQGRGPADRRGMQHISRERAAAQHPASPRSQRAGSGGGNSSMSPYQWPAATAGYQGSIWLAQAAESVRSKVKACKGLGILRTSLNPTGVPEMDWLRISNIGASYIARACTQRASVFVGSFVEEAGLHELSYAVSCEASLAIAFRQLRLGLLFPSGVLQDESNDSQCASLFAAVFGELVDAPMSGESNALMNARKVAEWAMLDFLFFLASGQVVVSLQAQASSPPPNGAIGYDG